MAPGNLPKGVSPACNDMMFGGQWTATRAALVHCLNTALGTGDILSHNDYPQQDGSTVTVMLYEDGTLWTKNVQSGATVEIGSVTPGVRFKSVAALDHFFMAFRGLGLTSPFTDAQWAGGDAPRYINPQGNMYRVTSDAPGGGFSVSSITLGPEDLVTPGAWVIGPDVVSVTLGGAKTVTINIPNRGVETITYYTTATVVLASAVTLAKGQVIQLYGLNWSGPQWANGVTVAAAVTSSTTFVIDISSQTASAPASAGTFATQATAGLALSRNQNIVTAYLEGTSPSEPTQIQQGYYVSITDTQESATATLPDGTVPFTGNELFQAIYPSSAGSGAPIGLLTGTTVLWNLWPENTPSYSTPEPTGTYTWTYPGDGGNDPYQPSTYNGQPNAGQFQLLNNQTLFFNFHPNEDPYTFWPGNGGFLVQSTQDHGGVTIPELNPDGTYAGIYSNPAPTGESFHGEGNNFDFSAYGTFVVSAPGNITFQMARSDGYLLGIKGATYVSGPQTSIVTPPQTLTAIKGYPLTVWNNTSGNGGSIDTFVINFPAAGNYDFELDMRHWTGSRMWFDMVYQVSGTNYPIMPTMSAGQAMIKGDGVGNIHVTLPTAIEALPDAAWLYLVINTPSPADVINWTISSSGTALIQLAANSNATFSVGEEILLNGFTGSGQPTGWNGQTVTITAIDVSTNEYQFNWSGPAGGGGSSTGTATPVSQQYPSGWIQVTQVVSNTEFVYFALGNTNTIVSQGVVYDYFGSLNTAQSLTPTGGTGSGLVGATATTQSTQSSASGIVQGFQVLSVNTTTTPNSITWYQSGFNDTYTGSHVLAVQPESQIAAGPRNFFPFFIGQDGSFTPGAYPILVNLNGGTQFPQVTLPLGPPGTTARGCAFTTAYGSDYFVLAQGNIPAQGGNGPVIVTGTIILDNTTIETIMDFSDTSLENGIFVGPGVNAVANDYGDLTSLIVLPPCLGVIEYNQQLVWWGELNCYPNHALVNMGFDGGTVAYSGSNPTGQPLGWDSTTVVNGITPDQSGVLALSPNGQGFAYEVDVNDGGSVGGTLNFIFWSPASGLISSATVPVTSLSTSGMAWSSTNFSAAIPNPIPPDLLFAVYVSGATYNCLISQGAYQNYYGQPVLESGRSYVMRFQAMVNTTTKKAYLDELEIIDAAQPVLAQQLRCSYIDSPFAYDDENGFTVGLDTPDFISACFLQRAFLCTLTEGQGELHVVQANAALPEDWSAKFFARECGCSGPDATANGQSVQWWMGRHGVHSYDGSQPHKLSQYNNVDFEQTNWSAAVNTCMAYDGVQRNLWMSFPTGQSTSPSQSYIFNFRLNDSQASLPDPVKVSQYTGKIIATDLSMKECPITVPFNSLGMSLQQTIGGNGYAKVMTFAGGAVGPVSFDASNTSLGDGSTTSVSITPGAPTDFCIFVTNNEGTISSPAGFSEIEVGMFTSLLTSAAPLTINATNVGIGESIWANAVCTLATTGTPSIVQTVSFGSGGIGSGAHTVALTSVVKGHAIVVTVSQDGPGTFTAPPTVTDDQGNLYFNVGTQQAPSGYTVGAWIFVALGVKGGTTHATLNLPAPLGNVISATAFEYSGINGPVGYGQLYQQDYVNYPPTNSGATSWNAADADYGTIPWNYTTYAFFSHDTELMQKLGYYVKIFSYMGMHVSGVGFLDVTPFADSLDNPWSALSPWTLQLKDPGIDYSIGLRVHAERMFLQFSGTPIPMAQGGDGVSSALFLTHLFVSASKDNVFPNRGSF